MKVKPGRILLTGAAGFIGYHVAERLLADGHEVVGLDNLNDYYDVGLKQARLERLRRHDGFRFEKLALQDGAGVAALFDEIQPTRVLHLAAQAGVRYSLQNPQAYIDSNLVGFANILEGCRRHEVEHLLFASSSSVYGANKRIPFRESDNVDHPISLYAATKKSNEMMAHSYAYLYGLPATGLRFFTVYGPWGRPDMAYYKFTEAMFAGRSIPVYNHGDMRRDFTYIDDVVEGVVRLFALPPEAGAPQDDEHPDPASSAAPYRIYNIGNHTPVPLLRMIELLEKYTGRQADKELLPMQPGDVPETYADVSALAERVGFAPETPLEEGLRRFVAWYREFHDC